MKKLVTGLLVLSMLAGTASLAEARDGRRGDRDRDGDRREHNDRNWRDNDGDRNWRRGDNDNRRWDRDDRRRAEVRRHSPRRWNWSRGHRFDWNYYRPHYHYVDNWSYYHLRRPPRGHRWVRIDGDYLLVAIATGIILEILANDRYDDHYYDDYYYR
jgi:Ni/Co efflux regulator RcnB